MDGDSEKPDIEPAGLKIWVHGRQNEDARDYSDGNWPVVTSHCAGMGSWASAAGAILHLSELAMFLEQCVTLCDTLQGTAELTCMEPTSG